MEVLLQDLAGSGGRGSQAAQGLRALLTMVDESYQRCDRAKELRLCSLSTRSAELLQAYTRLREDARCQQAIIDQMRTMANRILGAAGLTPIAPDEKSAERLIGILADLIAHSESGHASLRQSEAR